MQVELRPTDSTRPYENNPRLNDDAVEAVANSLREFGFRQPIVVDADGVIIVGHTRWKAAKRLGLAEVPVHVATDLSPEQIKAYRLADNRLAKLAEWGFDLLPIELGELQAADFDLSLIGFESDELDKLLNPVTGTEGQTDPDEVPDAAAEARSQREAPYRLGNHLLLCGDSTNREDVARVMGSDTARMCFTDPPWNVAIGQDSNPRHRQREGLANDSLSAAEFIDFLRSFIGAMKPRLEGDLYCVLGASEWPTLDSCLRAEGYHWSATVIWVKDLFVLGRSKYHRRYEPIWYGWHKDGKSSFGDDRSQDDVWEIARPNSPLN